MSLEIDLPDLRAVRKAVLEDQEVKCLFGTMSGSFSDN